MQFNVVACGHLGKKYLWFSVNLASLFA